MKILDNTEKVRDSERFEVGDIVKATDGNIFMIASNEDLTYYLVALGDGSISGSCDSIADLFEEGYLDDTDIKVSGVLTIERCAD
ncbi:hypothetical protein [Levilactobacillus phage ENFP1]|nr:hypothetical protein [Levilactobacillus phage ENFP1]